MDVGKQIAAGAAAGVCEYTTCQPVDIVATRCMLREGRGRSSMFAEFSHVWSNGGLRGVYRGLGPQILAAVPATIGMYVGERQVAALLRDEKGHLSDPAHFAAGMASGVCETTLVCPFEVVKVRLMSAEHNHRYRNTLHCFADIAQRDGLSTFYLGYPAMCARNMIFNSTFFFGVHLLQQRVFPKPLDASDHLAQDILAGMVMGFAASFGKMPFFVAKTRLQNQGAGGRYTGTIQCIQTIAAEEGVKALWKGVIPCGVRMSLGSAVCLPIFRMLCGALGVES